MNKGSAVVFWNRLLGAQITMALGALSPSLAVFKLVGGLLFLLTTTALVLNPTLFKLYAV